MYQFPIHKVNIIPWKIIDITIWVEKWLLTSFNMFVSVAVVIEYVVCSTPIHIILIINKNHLLDNVKAVRDILIMFSFLLNLSSTFIDPIIYSIMSTKFRKAIKVRKYGKTYKLFLLFSHVFFLIYNKSLILHVDKPLNVFS